jgi:hypothetical protein
MMVFPIDLARIELGRSFYLLFVDISISEFLETSQLFKETRIILFVKIVSI